MITIVVSALLLQAPPAKADQALMLGSGGKPVPGPMWRQRPTAEAYGVAVRKHVKARRGTLEAAAACVAKEDGSLELCSVVQEQPAGSGLAKALMELAPRFAVQPTTADGRSVAGRVIFVPIGVVR